MQFAAIAFLNDRLAGTTSSLITKLEDAVASGVVPNKLFVDAKDIFNRAAVEAAEAFLKTGPHVVGRDGQPHHQSDWWLGAYDADAFVSGTHTLHTVRNRAIHAGLTEYAAFIEANLLPLFNLLGAAKPLIKKRGELPVVKSAKQIADEALQMTCQCCGRGIFAATGTIAHHGYERPDRGWQTASCYGAKALPWEVSRDRLGDLIAHLERSLVEQQNRLGDTKLEKIEITHRYSVWDKVRRERVSKTVTFTRQTFDAVWIDTAEAFAKGDTFDTCKATQIETIRAGIAATKANLKECQTRYDGWKQTHKRDERSGKGWVAL